MKWLKGIALVFFFLVINTIVFVFTYRFASTHLYGSGDAVRNSNIVWASVGVMSIFLADVLVLWLLSEIGGPLKADVRASIEKFGGSIWITGAGLLGAFLTVAIVAFGGVYMFATLPR